MTKLLIAAVLLSGCASAYRAPCEYDIHVRLTEEADAECHKGTMIGHDGNRINNTTGVYGCGGADGIISNGTRSNLGHENMHVIEDKCPQWVDWN